MTNSWLYTSEVLKYYVFPNNTGIFDELNQPTYFKNATLGPWKFCWLDPVNDFHCNDVFYLIDEDPSDVTTSVQQSVRRAFVFMSSGTFLDVVGLILSFICCFLPNPYASLFFATIVHINAGIANFLVVIVYMSAVSKEVGNKIYPASEMDDPLFHYEYGFSFILFKCSFLITEMAALFSIVVYMAKRDERTFNRYKIRSLLNTNKETGEEELTDEKIREANHKHTRFSQLQARRKGSMNLENAPALEELVRQPSIAVSYANLRDSCQESFLPAVYLLILRVQQSANKLTAVIHYHKITTQKGCWVAVVEVPHPKSEYLFHNPKSLWLVLAAIPNTIGITQCMFIFVEYCVAEAKDILLGTQPQRGSSTFSMESTSKHRNGRAPFVSALPYNFSTSTESTELRM